MTMRYTLLALLLSLAVAVAPGGCIIGSPSAAISGEPYGWTVEDWRGATGDRKSAWRDHSVLAAIDLPFAAVLDTALLPISLILMGIFALADGDEDEEGRHDHGDGPHTHDGDEDHTHDEGGREVHSHGEGYQHSHEDGARPHSHEQ